MANKSLPKTKPIEKEENERLSSFSICVGEHITSLKGEFKIIDGYCQIQIPLFGKMADTITKRIINYKNKMGKKGVFVNISIEPILIAPEEQMELYKNRQKILDKD